MNFCSVHITVNLFKKNNIIFQFLYLILKSQPFIYFKLLIISFNFHIKIITLFDLK
jgi:hypothetical protein